MYNLLAIQFACVLVTDKLEVTPFNIIRDSIMQIITALGVLAVALLNIGEMEGSTNLKEHKGAVSWVECVGLIVLYVGYVIFMAFNSRVQACSPCCPEPSTQPQGHRLSKNNRDVAVNDDEEMNAEVGEKKPMG